MLLLMLLAILSVVSSAPSNSLPIASFPGECPDIKAMSDFNIEKWAKGAWYQLYVEASDKIHSNDQQKCIERRYTVNGNELDIEKYHVIDRQPVWLNSKLIITDKPGVFRHAPLENATEWYKKTEIYVVDTDYDQYCVVWACVYDDNANIRFETAGVSSRTNSLPEGKLEDITNFFANKSSEVRLVPIEWSDCRVKCQ